MLGSLFSYVATHQLSHRHNTIKCWVMSSVNSALDETRANRDCQEVYDSGEWEHCCVSMEKGKNGYIYWKLLLRYPSQSFRIGPGNLSSLSQPSSFNEPILSGRRRHGARLVHLLDNSCSWGQMFLTAITNIDLPTNASEMFMSGVGNVFVENPLLVWAFTSGSGAIGAATSHKSEQVINNYLQLWVCTV